MRLWAKEQVEHVSGNSYAKYPTWDLAVKAWQDTCEPGRHAHPKHMMPHPKHRAQSQQSQYTPTPTSSPRHNRPPSSTPLRESRAAPSTPPPPRTTPSTPQRPSRTTVSTPQHATSRPTYNTPATTQRSQSRSFPARSPSPQQHPPPALSFVQTTTVRTTATLDPPISAALPVRAMVLFGVAMASPTGSRSVTVYTNEYVFFMSLHLHILM